MGELPASSSETSGESVEKPSVREWGKIQSMLACI